jgi:hypothetical protein
MKLGKKSKVFEITNPLRPRTGAIEKVSTCRITKNSRLTNSEEFEYCIQVDADDNEEFLKFIQSLPKNSWYRNDTLEMWFVKEEHFEDICINASQCFKKVTYADATKYETKRIL